MEIVIKFKNWILEFRLVSRLTIIGVRTLCAHPLTLCLSIITLSSFIGIISGFIFIKWIFYAVALIFLGGIIVIFIYVTTLAGNEKFLLPRIPSTVALTILLIFIGLSQLPTTSEFKQELFITHTYSAPSIPVLCFLLIFLFRALFTVIKITESFKGALTKFI